MPETQTMWHDDAIESAAVAIAQEDPCTFDQEGGGWCRSHGDYSADGRFCSHVRSMALAALVTAENPVQKILAANEALAIRVSQIPTVIEEAKAQFIAYAYRHTADVLIDQFQLENPDALGSETEAVRVLDRLRAFLRQQAEERTAQPS